MSPAILVLTGASGAGKSTMMKGLESMNVPGVACFECDRIYFELPPEVRADGAAAQDAILTHWVAQASGQRGLRLALLNTQIRPQRAQVLLTQLGVRSYQVVLVDCESEERNARLRGPRAQPELAIAQMDCWAAYLRGQADALGIEVIDTSRAASADAVARLRQVVDGLLL
jgi:ABC-type taurine transport system ATPase subunit